MENRRGMVEKGLWVDVRLDATTVQHSPPAGSNSSDAVTLAAALEFTCALYKYMSPLSSFNTSYRYIISCSSRSTQ